MAAADTHAKIEDMLQSVFSVRSLLNLYNEGQLLLEERLETTARREGVWHEVVASLGVTGVE
jgi:hypothetical protein